MSTGQGGVSSYMVLAMAPEETQQGRTPSRHGRHHGAEASSGCHPAKGMTDPTPTTSLLHGQSWTSCQVQGRGGNRSVEKPRRACPRPPGGLVQSPRLSPDHARPAVPHVADHDSGPKVLLRPMHALGVKAGCQHPAGGSFPQLGLCGKLLSSGSLPRRSCCFFESLTKPSARGCLIRGKNACGKRGQQASDR